ncbi:MAG: hypothetical protein PHX72_00215 [Candidatus Shapirobacteria bacterium]|nr:hypothetical protein [Candidatus Shapirobacteria bacterium]
MNKVLMVILVLGAGALLYYFLAGRTDVLPPGVKIDENIDLEQVEEGLKETGKRTVYGSCNDIVNSSNCIDYVGSMWKDNNSAELNCGEGRNFSKNACPYSEFGGCQMNGGSVMELIAWVYEEGPGDYTIETVPDAAMACNGLPNAKWVTPESVLK